MFYLVSQRLLSVVSVCVVHILVRRNVVLCETELNRHLSGRPLGLRYLRSKQACLILRDGQRGLDECVHLPTHRHADGCSLVVVADKLTVASGRTS